MVCHCHCPVQLDSCMYFQNPSVYGRDDGMNVLAMCTTRKRRTVYSRPCLFFFLVSHCCVSVQATFCMKQYVVSNVLSYISPLPSATSSLSQWGATGLLQEKAIHKHQLLAAMAGLDPKKTRGVARRVRSLPSRCSILCFLSRNTLHLCFLFCFVLVSLAE